MSTRRVEGCTKAILVCKIGVIVIAILFTGANKFIVTHILAQTLGAGYTGRVNVKK